MDMLPTFMKLASNRTQRMVRHIKSKRPLGPFASIFIMAAGKLIFPWISRLTVVQPRWDEGGQLPRTENRQGQSPPPRPPPAWVRWKGHAHSSAAFVLLSGASTKGDPDRLAGASGRYSLAMGGGAPFPSLPWAQGAVC